MPVAYFFFDFNDPAKQTVDGMLRSVIFQLAASVETVPKALMELYARHNQDRGFTTQPTIEEWISTLLALLEDRDPFYIIIDALDECREEESLLDCIQHLVAQSTRSIRWLFTCQISDVVTSILQSANIKSVRIEVPAVNNDIATYLGAIVEKDNRLRSFSSKAKAKIRSEVQIKARGM